MEAASILIGVLLGLTIPRSAPTNFWVTGGRVLPAPLAQVRAPSLGILSPIIGKAMVWLPAAHHLPRAYWREDLQPSPFKKVEVSAAIYFRPARGVVQDLVRGGAEWIFVQH